MQFSIPARKTRNNGVAILLNHLDLITWPGDQEGRILTADISIQSRNIHVVNIYAPQCNYSTHNRIHFFDSLYSYTYSTHPTILTGDFNLVENPMLDRDPPSNKKDPTQSLQDLCSTFNLQDTFRSLYGDTRFFTRRQGQSQSRLDRFYVDKNFTTSSERSLPRLSSDHDIVVLDVIASNHSFPYRFSAL